MIAIGVEHDANGVVTCHVTIALHGMDGDAARIWIFACEAKIDPIAGHDDLDIGLIRRRLARFRCLLYKFHYRCISPGWFVKPAVENYGRRPTYCSRSDGSIGCDGTGKSRDGKKGAREPERRFCPVLCEAFSQYGVSQRRDFSYGAAKDR